MSSLYDQDGNYVGEVGDLADYQELAGEDGDEVGFGFRDMARFAGRAAGAMVPGAGLVRGALRGGGGRPRPAPQQQQRRGDVPSYENKPEILLAFGPSLGIFDTDHGTVEFKAQPQKRFRPERLVIDFARQGTTASGVVLLEDLAVGTDPQAAALGGFPAAAFSPLAVATRLKLREADVGITITVRLRCEPLPQGTDKIVVCVGLIGRAL